MRRSGKSDLRSLCRCSWCTEKMTRCSLGRMPAKVMQIHNAWICLVSYLIHGRLFWSVREHPSASGCDWHYHQKHMHLAGDTCTEVGRPLGEYPMQQREKVQSLSLSHSWYAFIAKSKAFLCKASIKWCQILYILANYLFYRLSIRLLSYSTSNYQLLIKNLWTIFEEQ